MHQIAVNSGHESHDFMIMSYPNWMINIRFEGKNDHVDC